MSRPRPSACRFHADATSPVPNRMRPHPRPILPIPFPVSALCCAAAVTTASALMGRGRSLWFDEQYSLILASKPVPELIRLTAVDAHPPLYYLMLKSWMPLAQGNIDMLRTFNCLLLGAAVLTLLVMLRDLFGERVACLCMPLLLCGGFMLRYGYELRMYSMAMLLATLGTYALVHAAGITVVRHTGQTRPGPAAPRTESRSPSAVLGWWAAYAVIVALGMLTLYLTAFVWFTHAVWLAIRSVKAVRRDESGGTRADGTWHGWRWMLAYVASILLFLPWMPAAIGQVRGSSSVLPPVTRRMNMSGVANALDVMLLGMTEDEIPAPASLMVGAIVLAAAGSLVAAYTACMCTPRWTDAENGMNHKNREDQTSDMDRMSAMTLIVMLFVVPTTLLILWSAIQETANGGYGMFSVRYLSVVAPFLYTTLGVSFAMPLTEGRASPAPSPGIAVLRRTTVFRHLTGIAYVVTLVTILAGAIVFGVRGNHSFDRDDTPGSAALSRQVECSETHPVVAQDEYTYIDAYWYYRDCPAYRFLDADDVPARGGYAPLHGSAAQLRSLDDLDATGFTLLSWSTTRDYDRLLDSDKWTRTGIVKHDANAAITYREYREFPTHLPPAKFNWRHAS
ncbi:membrane protein of unknown function [Bifidobacterium callitrichos DSM 23973]|uniref:Glycosyltransferase RgtA/B/C/D-like domain-containing protein n=1 Tax=Bifidobacterium callitrichos DSM 23973 TaxID=1437609 RepID=A0A087A7H8_9BIFI|nr:membrane protein of unknown function [Bifidobacterium callitrichos DSM 23973]